MFSLFPFISRKIAKANKELAQYRAQLKKTRNPGAQRALKQKAMQVRPEYASFYGFDLASVLSLDACLFMATVFEVQKNVRKTTG